MDFKPVPSKLLLFGEFSILYGSQAITLPLWDYTAKLVLKSEKSSDPTSHQHLKNFVNFLSQSAIFEKHLDLPKLNEYANAGMFLQSDIPQGYGLGSSASLCVAVYKSFGTSNLKNPNQLKELYSQLESFFHGKSSGLDPLPIHFEKAILVKEQTIQSLSLQHPVFPGLHLYLLDSGMARNSAEKIKTFKTLMENSAYKNDFEHQYLPLLHKLIDSTISYNPDYWADLKMFSEMQLTFFREMIPDEVYPLWKNNLDSGEVCFKILGAGGGGFFLLFSKREIETLGVFNLKKLDL